MKYHRLKKIFRQIHLWLGLLSGIVILIVTLTGASLVFETELKNTFDKSFYKVVPGAQKASADSIISNVRKRFANIKINSINIPSEPDATIIINARLGKQATQIAINPYTGQIIKAKNQDKDIFRTLLQLHRYLCMGATGKIITGIAALMFISLMITGFILWWPKNKKILTQRLRVKWSGTAKRINWDLHAVTGFYTGIVIFIIACTGLVWSYKAVDNSIFYIFDGKKYNPPEAPNNTIIVKNGNGFFDSLVYNTQHLLPYKGSIQISIPAKDSLPITVTKTNDEAAVPNVVDFLYYEKGTGKLLGTRLYKNEPTGMKVRRLIYPIHTGSIFGTPSKIIAFIAVLFAASLPVTGTIIFIAKKRKKRIRKKGQLNISV